MAVVLRTPVVLRRTVDRFLRVGPFLLVGRSLLAVDRRMAGRFRLRRPL